MQRLQRMLSEENPPVVSFGPEVARPEFEVDLVFLIENFRASREELRISGFLTRHRAC